MFDNGKLGLILPLAFKVTSSLRNEMIPFGFDSLHAFQAIQQSKQSKRSKITNYSKELNQQKNLLQISNDACIIGHNSNNRKIHFFIQKLLHNNSITNAFLLI